MSRKIGSLFGIALLGACTSTPKPSNVPSIVSSSSDDKKINRGALFMERQMAQTEAERRLIRKILESKTDHSPSDNFPLPTEEELHIAGELLSQQYKKSKKIPRKDLVSLLVSHMNLGSPSEASAKAEVILNLIMGTKHL
ncbi:MAG: hypothetical protein K2P90_01220 [Holosporales bacterium]|nr:hypothetical protein [Holosporales bacterium]